MAFDTDSLETTSQFGGSDNIDPNAGTDVEYVEDAPNVRARPTAVIEAEGIEYLNFTGRVDHDQNVFVGSDDFENRGQSVIGLRDAVVRAGSVWEYSEDDWWDYYVLDTEASDVDFRYDSNGDVIGVEAGNGDFDGVEADGLPEDVVDLVDSTGTALYLMKSLDVLGGGRAGITAEEHEEDWDSHALVEYPPEGVDASQRVARTPDLRSDMIDQPVRIFYEFGEQSQENWAKPHRVHVYRIPEVGAPEDAGELLTPLDWDDEAAGKPSHPSHLEWGEHFSSDNDDDVDPSQSIDGASTSIDFGNTGTDEPESFEDLAEQDKQYVRDAVTFLEEHGETDLRDVIEDYESTYEEQIANGEATGDVGAETIADIIATEL